MNNKIKIMYYLPNLEGGGAERVAVNMIRILNKKQFNISLVLVNKIGPYINLIPDDVNVIDLGMKRTIYSFFKLHKIIQEIQPDIVFSTLFRTHTTLDMALVGIKNKPFVILRSPTSPKLVLADKELSPIRKILLERAYRNADIIIAQTPEMKDEIVHYHHINDKKIRVMLNPLDTELIDKKVENIENPFDSTRTNIVAAGRLGKEKGFDILIKSFEYVVEKNSDYILHIIGKDGGEKEKLIKLTQKLSLKDNVVFWGFQQNPYKFFFFSDLYVLSSYREGMPNTVLENLYLKKPIVATRCIPFMNTLIENGENGLLVDTGESKQLANAIMNYKSIDVNKSKFIGNQNDINELFLNARRYIGKS